MGEVGDQVAAAVAAVGCENPSLAEWFAGGDQAFPNRSIKPALNRAGWPKRMVRETVDGPEQLVVPASWLRRLAAILAWPESRVFKS